MTIQPVAYQQPAYQPPPPRTMQGISQLIQGFSKAGKSTYGDSGPKPQVTLDVEGASYWTPSRKVYWEPSRETVPQQGRRLTAGYGHPSITPDWETAIVLVRDAATVASVYTVLNSGNHPFSSVTIDSVTEVQQRIIDSLTGGRPMDRDKWGALLRQVNSMIRQYRDLVIHPTHPLWSVCMTAGTHYDQKMGKWRPLLQGAASDYAPYYVDLLGYMGAMPDNTRQLLVGPHPQYETGHRFGRRLPYSLLIGDGYYPGYNIQSILQQVLQGGARS
jgi:hypothetical protein